MMVNSKDKGNRFEREISKILESRIKRSTWRRIPMSGAIGTIVGESTFTGDIFGKVEGFPKTIKGECKSGYNRKNSDQKSFTIKKEWLDKVIVEAEKTFSLPALFIKFDNVRVNDGVKYAVVLDLDTFIELIELARGEYE